MSVRRSGRTKNTIATKTTPAPAPEPTGDARVYSQKYREPLERYKEIGRRRREDYDGLQRARAMPRTAASIRRDRRYHALVSEADRVARGELARLGQVDEMEENRKAAGVQGKTITY
jgi:hypothetical protein